MPGKPYTTAFCSVCGEKVSDGRHKLIGGRPVCKSCAEGSYYEIIEE
jgi:formylmethanofuran dehydrogenase subunit E